MIRLFVALGLPDTLRGELAAMCGGIPGARWVPEENYHLTLRFIGEVPGWQAQEVDEALAGIRASGLCICPALEGREELSRWAGLRPITPDGQPILGADPEHPALLYATGHSRNGVLLAPITGDAIAALAAGEPPPADLFPFAPDRFGERTD